MQAVISAYQEDVSWIRNIPDQWEVVVYYKHLHFPKCIKRAKAISLENIGRESHTYVYHICENYHNLHDRIIFLQGNPFDHSPNVLDFFQTL